MNMQLKNVEKRAKAIDLDRCYAASDRQQDISRRSQALLAAAGMDEPARRWFVVMVDSGMDEDVGQALVFSNIECWLPQVAVKPARRGGMKPAVRPVTYRLALPGYVLVRVAATSKAWTALNSIKGVSKILGMDGRPSAVRDEDIDLLRAYFSGDANAAAIITNALKASDIALIKDGPFRSFSGAVVSVNADRGRAILDVLMFGRISRTEVDLAQLSKL